MSVSLEVIVTEHLTRVNDLQPQLFGTLIVHYIIVRYNHNCHHIIVHHVVRYVTTQLPYVVMKEFSFQKEIRPQEQLQTSAP